MKTKTLLFLYGNANIVGSILGIVGLLLYCSPLINMNLPFLLIVPALYFIGFLTVSLFFTNPAYELHFRHQATIAEVQGELDNLVKSIRNNVSPDILARVERIKTSILDILPYIMDIDSSDHNIYIIRQTALDYLPNALQNYMNLPRAFATMHPIKDGKTAKQLLIEQLSMLEQQMSEIAVDFHNNNSQNLIIHGRFLEGMFQKGDLLADM